MSLLFLKDKSFDLSVRPLIMGILNVTPDSFSDGNLFLHKDQALKQAEQMILDGADIIDIGGESTRPGADFVSVEEELDRILPVLQLLKKEFSIPVSIDTYKADVASAVAGCGAEMLNDITGLDYNPELADIAASFKMAICLMHTRGTPQTMQLETGYDDLIGEIGNKLNRAAKLCLEAGVRKESIVLDPGIGFGKSVAGNLQIINQLQEFTKNGFPLLIGTSRKSFIGKVLDVGVSERLYGTISSNVIALMHGAAIFRVHDVKAHRQALDLAMAVMNSK